MFGFTCASKKIYKLTSFSCRSMMHLTSKGAGRNTTWNLLAKRTYSSVINQSGPWTEDVIAA